MSDVVFGDYNRDDVVKFLTKMGFKSLLPRAQAMFGNQPNQTKEEKQEMVENKFERNKKNFKYELIDSTSEQGDKKFKKFLLAEKFESAAKMGQDQEAKGAHVLDVCTAVAQTEILTIYSC